MQPEGKHGLSKALLGRIASIEDGSERRVAPLFSDACPFD